MGRELSYGFAAVVEIDTRDPERLRLIEGRKASPLCQP